MTGDDRFWQIAPILARHFHRGAGGLRLGSTEIK